MFKNLII